MGNSICQLLGIKYPILQGGMAWVSCAQLAAAVSEAGGLGIIGAGSLTPDELQREIVRVRQLTRRPFGVNIMLLRPDAEAQIDVVVREQVPVVTTGAGSPARFMPQLKAAGIKVLPVVASAALARRLERLGVDAIIAEGQECGGHIGSVSTMTLVPRVVDAVSLPVIAAGGIADARGIVAAFALGAEGVQMGTRFICTCECTVHPSYKEAILKAKERDAIVCGHSTGHPVRVLRNRLTRQIERLECSGADPRRIEELGQGKLRLAAVEGDIVNGSVMAGQCAGMIDSVKPVQSVINEIMADLPRLSTIIGGKPWED